MKKIGKIGMFILAVVIALTVFTAPAPAIAASADSPVVLGDYFPFRYFVAAVRVPITFVSKVANCKGTWDCINVPGKFGGALATGVEEVVITTGNVFSGFQWNSAPPAMGQYGKVSSHKILGPIVNNGLGYAGLGLGVGALLNSAAHYSVFGLSEASTIAWTGVVAGEGIAALEISGVVK